MNNKLKNRILISLLFLAILGIGATAWTASGNYITNELRIENKTRALIVESIKKAGKKNDQNIIEASLKNTYDNPISAYRVLVSEELNGKADMVNLEMRNNSGMRLWRDTNHNGVSEASEMHRLEELGLRTIDLDYKESRRVDEHGNRFKYRAKVKDAQGAQLGRWAWDVYLVVQQP